jgi:hypothetical protein
MEEGSGEVSKELNAEGAKEKRAENAKDLFLCALCDELCVLCV